MSAARELEDQGDPQETYESAVALALRGVAGCDAAALTVVRRGRKLHSPAATHTDALDADDLQYELGQGPCVDAAWRHRIVHSPDLGTDPRWSQWGPRVAARGFGSVLSFQLFTHERTLGALNLYSRRVRGFDRSDRDHGVALAAHVAVATRSAQQIEGLAAALESRTTIGTATGIVMERFDLSSERAFALLTRLSTTRNLRLRAVADDIVANRGVPDLDEDGSLHPG